MRCPPATVTWTTSLQAGHQCVVHPPCRTRRSPAAVTTSTRQVRRREVRPVGIQAEVETLSVDLGQHACGAALEERPHVLGERRPDVLAQRKVEHGL